MFSLQRFSLGDSHSEVAHGESNRRSRRSRLGDVMVCIGLFTATCASERASADDPNQDALSDIVVTAQSFNSTVQNTPISLSAISGEQLDAAGITSVEELAQKIPGLVHAFRGAGQTEYEARGLSSSGGSAPTVDFIWTKCRCRRPRSHRPAKSSSTPTSTTSIASSCCGTTGHALRLGFHGRHRPCHHERNPNSNTLEGSVQGTLSDTQGGSGNGGGSFMLNVPVGDPSSPHGWSVPTPIRSGWIDRVVLILWFPQDGAVDSR